jgi:hypothetical protein
VTDNNDKILVNLSALLQSPHHKLRANPMILESGMNGYRGEGQRGDSSSFRFYGDRAKQDMADHPTLFNDLKG